MPRVPFSTGAEGRCAVSVAPLWLAPVGALATAAVVGRTLVVAGRVSGPCLTGYAKGLRERLAFTRP